MAKFKKILIEKIEDEKLTEKKQEKLRDETGIKDRTIFLREKTWASYGREFILRLGYAVYVMLAFIGVVMVLYPQSREILLNLFRLSPGGG